MLCHQLQEHAFFFYVGDALSPQLLFCYCLSCSALCFTFVVINPKAISSTTKNQGMRPGLSCGPRPAARPNTGGRGHARRGDGAQHQTGEGRGDTTESIVRAIVLVPGRGGGLTAAWPTWVGGGPKLHCAVRGTIVRCLLRGIVGGGHGRGCVLCSVSASNLKWVQRSRAARLS